jgi:hypothetical protein
MVMPVAFQVAEQSARDNPYLDLDSAVDPQRALSQSLALADAIEAVGVPVQRFAGDPDCPDGVFPNNVFGTTPGRLVIGSMRHPVRRAEAVNPEIRAYFRDRELVDLSERDLVAELTGAMVIDRARGIGYCGMSQRVDPAGLAAMHEAFGLRLSFHFDLAPDEYHTNVVLSVLASRACVLHPDAFTDPAACEAIAAVYPGRTLRLNEEEKLAFAANCIALTERDLFLSATAARVLRPASREALESWGFTLHAVELDEIEKAGGSLRCMIAEIF